MEYLEKDHYFQKNGNVWYKIEKLTDVGDLDEYSRGTLESIFKQIYAIFIHIYTMHINDIMMQQLDYQFNYSFKRFLLFSIEFKLLSAKYLEPFKPQLKEIFGIEKLT